MKQTYFPGLVNLFEVSDPDEINALSDHPVIDRLFETPTCPINWFLVKRSLSVLSFRGRRFPTMEPRYCSARDRRQIDLWNRLSESADSMRAGPVSLAGITSWITGTQPDEEVGILTQQLLGCLFKSDFQATPESWNAAKVLVAAPRSPNLPKMLWWFATGKVTRAKRLLASMVDDDLFALNAIGIAVHNMVKGLRRMRAVYADLGMRNSLSAEAAAAECLFAPMSVFRQATAPGRLGDCPFPDRSLFVFNIGEASRKKGGRPLVFMEESWSRCPASFWVPAFFEGVWKRATPASGTPAPKKGYVSM